MSVVDIDKGWKNFVKQAEFYTKHEVVLGWVEGGKPRKNGEPITNATLATVHEFGTDDGRIPEGRLGLREFVDRSQNEIGRMIEKTYKAAVPHGDAKKELTKLGLWAEAAWKKYLRDVQPGPDLADSTKASKLAQFGDVKAAANKKLIDTGQLINGITSVVRRKTR